MRAIDSVTQIKKVIVKACFDTEITSAIQKRQIKYKVPKVILSINGQR